MKKSGRLTWSLRWMFRRAAKKKRFRVCMSSIVSGLEALVACDILLSLSLFFPLLEMPGSLFFSSLSLSISCYSFLVYKLHRCQD